MSLDETMKKHMDAVRKATGTTDKLSLAGANAILTSMQGFDYHGLINDGTSNVENIDFQELRDNGYYLIQTTKMKNMPVPTWGTLANFTALGDRGYGLRVWITSDKGIYVAGDNTAYKNQWFKLGGVFNRVLIGFVAPRLEVAA